MSVIVLTLEERTRFADYLEYDAKTDLELSEQLAKLGAGHEQFIMQKKLYASAALLVVRKLRQTEAMKL